MPTELWVALISGLCSVLGTFAGIVVSSNLTNYRIEQLEKKDAAHNNLIDRTYRLEAADGVHTEQIKVINHRLSDLEAGHE